MQMKHQQERLISSALKWLSKERAFSHQQGSAPQACFLAALAGSTASLRRRIGSTTPEEVIHPQEAAMDLVMASTSFHQVYSSFFGIFMFFFGGFQGQVRWAEGPPHLALNPPCFFVCFVFLFSFLSFLCFSLKKLVAPWKGAFCVYFWVSPLFLLSLFGLPFSNLSFFSLLLFSLFLPFCLSLCCFLLVPFFCLFLSFSFLFAFV